MNTKKIGQEAQEQIAFMRWLKLQYPSIEKVTFHIPNERKCSVYQGQLLKKMGVKSGVSDIFIAVPNEHYHGLFIEMKSTNGKPTPNQIQFINSMNKNGYLGCFCFGWTEARHVTQNYLKSVKKEIFNNH